MKSLALAVVAVLSVDASLGAAGRQLSGQWAPASTPALSPADAQKKFTVPEGFEVRLFAAEPEVVNPVAMTWDDRGRLWVVELLEYPLGAKAGEKGRDRVKVLEDTDNDGRADKVTVFADGLSLATGIALGDGGVYVGQAPHLLFFKDTNGDDKADEKQIVMTGFGLEDRHELLNSFAWGPDGALHMTHGVFTISKVKNPDEPNAPEVLMTAAVARFFPKTKRFEIVSEGTSNPWGVDWDAAGNAFVSACVIDHLFHVAPGGLYVRQAGNPPFPYAYQLLPSIVDHKHHMAAYAGVQVYQGDQFPAEYKGTILEGNIHDNAVHQDKLTPNGSTFQASFIKDFVRASDGWFRPVSTQVGPDGCVWIMDWYDKYPCYQNANADPEGVDRERGRIWRVVHTGGKTGAKIPPHPDNLHLGKLSNEDLARTLKHPNVWQRRMAQRLLNDRARAGQNLAGILPVLRELFAPAESLDTRMAALWTGYSTGVIGEEELDGAANADIAPARAWAARFTGERGEVTEQAGRRLYKLSTDADPSVRLGVATAIRQYVSGSLTIDTPPRTPPAGGALALILSSVISQPGAGDDPLLPFMCWMALEPVVVTNAREVLGWFVGNAPEHPEMCSKLLYKIARRLCDTQEPQKVGWMMGFLEKVPKDSALILRSALDGLIEGQRGKVTSPAEGIAVIGELMKHADAEVAARAQRLGALWGDPAALENSIRVLNNASASIDQRVATIQALKQVKAAGAADPVRVAFLDLAKNSDERLAVEAIRGLADVGGNEIPNALLASYKTASPTKQRAIAEVLTSRRDWTQELLNAIEKKTVGAGDLPAPVVRSLVNSRDENTKARAAAVIGRFREANADKLKVIAQKKQVVMNGPIDLKAGHELAKKTCLTCHKLHGEGTDVGPDLTGVGRSSLDALLANVIDPNQVVGKGYENVEIETKDGRSVSGRIVEENDARIKLLSAGPKEEVVAKSDIATKRVSEMSLMPEGLEQMSDADFRNLIGYILNPPQDEQRK